MKNAKITDFDGDDEAKIIIHSRWFYIFRLGGFFIGVIIQLFWLIRAMFAGDIKHAVILMFALIPFGFVGFILSFEAPSFCKLCGERLETFWSNEVRANRRYSGTISVCEQCRKFEARITYDSVG